MNLTIQKQSEWRYFMLFGICLSVIFVYISKVVLISDNLIYDFYSEQLSFEQIDSLLKQQKQMEWVAYVAVVIFYLFKILSVSICVFIGFFFLDKPIRFKSILSSVITADIVFFIPIMIKIIWFAFIVDHYSLMDIQQFYPLSLLNFFDTSTIAIWLLYPLQIVNAFEVLFWFALAYQLKEYLKNDFTESFKFVLTTYGSGLFVWVIFVVFLTVNNS